MISHKIHKIYQKMERGIAKTISFNNRYIGYKGFRERAAPIAGKKTVITDINNAFNMIKSGKYFF